MINEIMNLPWGRLFLMMLSIYCLFCFLAWIYADRILFPAPETPGYSDDDVNVRIALPDGKVIRCNHYESESASLCILFSHGNGEDLGGVNKYLNAWKGSHWDLLAYDYPGYGLSDGSPSEENCYLAIEAAYKFIIEKLGFKPNQIVLWGRSLGTGPTLHIAETKEVGGIILESPFTSAFRTVTEIQVIPWDRFPNVSRAQSIRCRSLVIHGDLDEVVPLRQGRKIYELLAGPKEFIEIKGANHNDLSLVGAGIYDSEIKDFLNSIVEG